MNIVTANYLKIRTKRPLGLLSALNGHTIRCETPLHCAGRWIFQTTSKPRWVYGED